MTCSNDGQNQCPKATLGDWYCIDCEEHVNLSLKATHISSPSHMYHVAALEDDSPDDDAVPSGVIIESEEDEASDAEEGGDDGYGSCVKEDSNDLSDGEHSSDDSEASGYDNSDDMSGEDNSNDNESEVDSEEMVDEEEDEEEDKEECEEEDKEECEAYDVVPMLWTCTLCEISVNIFARDDHIVSRSHTRKAWKILRPHNTSPSEPPLIPVWLCVPCNEEMHPIYRTEHLGGELHLRTVSEKRPTDEPSPARGPSIYSADELDENDPIDNCSADFRDAFLTIDELHQATNTFYCLTCAKEFPLSDQDQHVGDTIACEICTRQVHNALLEEHLSSHEERDWEPLVGQTLFYCATCDLEHTDDQRNYHPTHGWYCNICNTILVSGSEESHLDPREDNASVQQTAPSTDPPSPRGMFLCELCDNCIFPLHLKELHRGRWVCIICSRTMHLSDRASHLSSHDLENFSYHCQLCNEHYTSAGKAAHLAEEKHRMNMAATKQRINPPPVETAVPTSTKSPSKRSARRKKPDTFLCEVCNKRFSNVGKEGHLNGQKHVTKAAARATKASSKLKAQSKPKEKSKPTAESKPTRASRSKAKQKPTEAEPKPKAQPEPTKRAEPKAEPKPKAMTSTAPAPEVTFYCNVCKKHKHIVGRETHMASPSHRKRATEQQGGENMHCPVAPLAKGRSEPALGRVTIPQTVVGGGAKQPVKARTANAAPIVSSSSQQPGQEYTPMVAAASIKVYCAACKKYKSADGIANHKKSKKHKQNVAKVARAIQK